MISATSYYYCCCCFWLTAIVIAVAFPATIHAAAETGSPSWTVYHSWDGGNHYSRRGVLEWTEDGFILQNDDLTKEQIAAILNFGWYHVKIDTTDGDYVLATVPACSLRRANYKDEFTLTLPRISSNELQITSLAYAPLISPLAPKTCDQYNDGNEQQLSLLPTSETVQFTSKVHATLDTPSMTLRTILPKMKPPPGYTWLIHPNAKKGSAGTTVPPSGIGEAAEHEEGGDKTQSFFMKYWYMILPLVLANFLPASGENPPPSGGEGTVPLTAAGAPGTAAPTTAAATGGGAAAPSTGGGGGSKSSRRGKRG